MRILLDENLPHKLRIALAGREVLTVAYMGWSGLKNGELIRVAEADGIDVLVTGDQNIAYQQNYCEPSTSHHHPVGDELADFEGPGYEY